jgi:hypothetical protein
MRLGLAAKNSPTVSFCTVLVCMPYLWLRYFVFA